MVFRPARATAWAGWTLGTQPISVAQEYKYLGLYFHSTKGWSYMRDKLADKARGALISLYRHATDLRMGRSKPELWLRLFDTLVRPAASYACPVWATQLQSCQQAASNVLEKVHTSFLRHFWGLRQYVSPWVLYAEHNRQPLAISWWKQTVGFWNKITALPGTSLVRAVLAQNMADHAANRGVSNWTTDFVKFIDQFRSGFKLTSPLPQFSCQEHTKLYKSYLWQQVADMAANSVRLSTYFGNFSHRRGRPVVRDWPDGIKFAHMATLVRFRTGCHDLLVEKGRWLRIPREQRICTLCSQGLQDEHHLVFACPALDDIRARFRGLFKHATLAAFFAFNYTGPLLAFLIECLRRVQAFQPLTHP